MPKKKTGSIIAKAAVIIGVLVIPLMYSYFYLGAFWDPYARLDDVPVAVVNLDKGATINGKERNLGNEICENLEKDGTLKFEFTDEKTADDGVLNQDYYAEIIIPSDFSDNVATVGKDTEKIHSIITYKANQKKNYLAAQILENAMPTIKQTVNSNIDKEIVQTLCDNINSVPEQMEELQDGFNQLSDGSQQLTDGTKKLDNGASDLKDGSHSLADGSKKVSDGTQSLKNGISQVKDGTDTLNSSVPMLVNGVEELNNGAVKVNDGANALNSGLKKYANGVESASSGASELKNGISQYTSGVSAASTGSQALYDGIKTAYDGVSQMTEAVDKSVSQLDKSASDETLDYLNSGAEKVSKGISDYSDAYETAMNYLDIYKATKNEDAFNAAYQYFTVLNSQMPALKTGAAQVSSGVTVLTSGMKEVKTNTKTLLVGLNQLKDGFGSENNSNTLLGGSYQLSLGLNQLKENNEVLNNGMNSLAGGLNTLNKNSSALTSGAGELAEGTKKLSSGTATLNSKAPALASGVSSLAGGADKLLSGADSLKSGAAKVSDGAVELYKGVLTLKSGTSALNDGANELNDGINTAKKGVDDSVKDTNEKLKALSGLPEYAGEPVNTVTEYVQPVENYGSAFAPYFMGLSLWVGGLMIFFGIYLDYNKKIKTLTRDTDNRFVRGLAFVGISTAQGVMLAMVIKYALGITVNNTGLLYSSCILTSLTFMLIIQFFIMYFGNAGKFISLLLLILQLTSSAGTFPIETQSEFFQVINKVLPMTYSTQLFKEAISGTSGDWAGKNAWVLIGFMLAFIALTCVALVIENFKDKKISKPINQ